MKNFAYGAIFGRQNGFERMYRTAGQREKMTGIYVPHSGSEGLKGLELLKISNSIWHYLLSHGIIITVEYLPSKLNVQADWESRNARDPSDWKLHQSMFQSIIKHFRYPVVDLFTSRLCHQLPQYDAWKPNPNS